VPSFVLTISYRLLDALSLQAANGSAASFSARPDCFARRLSSIAHNESRAFSDRKTQEGTMDSRLRGNDKLRWQGKETLFKQSLQSNILILGDALGGVRAYNQAY
jgi:hypothetical protein